MKAKTVLCLSVGLVLFLLGGFVMNCVVQAQQKMDPFRPVPVGFVEDPFRFHGKQIQSWYVEIPATDSQEKVLEVPIDKRLIITDIYGLGTHYWISPTQEQVDARGYFDSNLFLSFNSGISFEPGEELFVSKLSITPDFHLTISGFFVDL